MQELLKEIKACQICVPHLPLGPNPVVSAHPSAKILLIGQAPGTKVHHSSIPWNDPSGDRLRQWLDLDKERFYDASLLAIVPMGFCYPGKGKSGDLPPRTECAPQWHKRLLAQMPDIKLTLLIGQYAQGYYLGDNKPKTLTETVKNWEHYLPEFLPLPHPSPRNIRWFKKNPWFEQELIPLLKQRIQALLHPA